MDTTKTTGEITLTMRVNDHPLQDAIDGDPLEYDLIHKANGDLVWLALIKTYFDLLEEIQDLKEKLENEN